jgi:hypothetical protein
MHVQSLSGFRVCVCGRFASAAFEGRVAFESQYRMRGALSTFASRTGIHLARRTKQAFASASALVHTRDSPPTTSTQRVRLASRLLTAAAALFVVHYAYHSSSHTMSAQASKPASKEVMPLEYASVQRGLVQVVDMESSVDPLPVAAESVELGSLIPEHGALIYLVRRPG